MALVLVRARETVAAAAITVTVARDPETNITLRVYVYILYVCRVHARTLLYCYFVFVIAHVAYRNHRPRVEGAPRGSFVPYTPGCDWSVVCARGAPRLRST